MKRLIAVGSVALSIACAIALAKSPAPDARRGQEAGIASPVEQPAPGDEGGNTDTSAYGGTSQSN